MAGQARHEEPARVRGHCGKGFLNTSNRKKGGRQEWKATMVNLVHYPTRIRTESLPRPLALSLHNTAKKISKIIAHRKPFRQSCFPNPLAHMIFYHKSFYLQKIEKELMMK